MRLLRLLWRLLQVRLPRAARCPQPIGLGLQVVAHAAQAGDGFAPFPTRTGTTVELISAGTVPPAVMFQHAEEENVTMTWVLRLIGVIFMLIGFNFVLRPLAVAGSKVMINYARDHQRLFEAIRRQKADRLICISGDTHYAEVSRLDTNVPYPIWDVTSSGLTEVWPVTPPNALRVSPVVRDRNFGLIEIDWSSPAPVVTVRIHDEQGAVNISQRIETASLAVSCS